MNKMTCEEAHAKVNKWFNTDKSEYIYSDTEAHQFGKVNIHAVIDEIFGVVDVYQIKDELKKLERDEIKFIKYIDDKVGGDTNKGYLMSSLDVIQATIKKIRERIHK